MTTFNYEICYVIDKVCLQALILQIVWNSYVEMSIIEI